MITALLITGATLWLLSRNKRVSGIGATKRAPRRIWSEVEAAQKAGIDLTDPNGWEKHAQVLRKLSNGKLTASKSDKPDEQRYFNQLRRAYKSIAGTNLQPKQSVVRNEYGDVILVYNDYELDKLPQKAADYVRDFGGIDGYEMGYWRTLADIATGRVKFVWSSKGVHRGVEKLIFGTSAPAERKARISYLATPEKGGVYPEIYAHKLWENEDQVSTDMDFLDGVLDAIRTCQSVGQAQKILIDNYMKAHQAAEPMMWEDVPF